MVPLVNQPNQLLTQTDVRAIVLHELALALQETGVRRPQGPLRSVIGRIGAMQTALGVMPREDSDLAAPRIACSDRGRRFREFDVEPNRRFCKCDRLDCYWETRAPFGIQNVALGRPASEPSELAAATMPAPEPTGGAIASGSDGTQPFVFEIGSRVANPRVLSKIAARLTTPEICTQPVDVVRPGDRLYKLDKLSGVEGIRRAQPKPAAAAAEAPGARCATSHYPAGIVAAPTPPLGTPSGATLAMPAKASKIVKHYWRSLEQAVAEGACTHVQPRAPTAQSRNEALRHAMQIRPVFGVIYYIIGQEEFYRNLLHKAEQPVAGHSSLIASYHARSGGVHGAIG